MYRFLILQSRIARIRSWTALGVHRRFLNLTTSPMNCLHIATHAHPRLTEPFFFLLRLEIKVLCTNNHQNGSRRC